MYLLKLSLLSSLHQIVLTDGRTNGLVFPQASSYSKNRASVEIPKSVERRTDGRTTGRTDVQSCLISLVTFSAEKKRKKEKKRTDEQEAVDHNKYLGSSSASCHHVQYSHHVGSRVALTTSDAARTLHGRPFLSNTLHGRLFRNH